MHLGLKLVDLGAHCSGLLLEAADHLAVLVHGRGLGRERARRVPLDHAQLEGRVGRQRL